MTDELVQAAYAKINGEPALAEMRHMPGLCVRSKYPDDLDPEAWSVPGLTVR
jgi:hypothetical protein